MLANIICQDVGKRASHLKTCGVYPKLNVITSGDNAAGRSFLKRKERTANVVGIHVEHLHIDFLTEERLRDVLVGVPTVVQTPIVGDANVGRATSKLLDPSIDVDGIAESNLSALFTGGSPCFRPCTPEAIVQILDYYGIKVEGAHVCVIGRGNTVGRPLAAMLEQRNATVSLCHSKTPDDIADGLIASSDVVVSAIGAQNNIVDRNSKFLSRAVVVDVGLHIDENGRLRGDISPSLYGWCGAYTPVPGGIGPVTSAIMMEHVVAAYERGIKGRSVAQALERRYNRVIHQKQGVEDLVWVCTNCGHRLKREGYTEICPNCWQPSMRKDDDVEQRTAPTNQSGDQGAAGG